MDDDIAGHLARNMKALRAARGLTQQRCADAAGLPRPTWASLESGAANPTLSVVVRVAGALGVGLDELTATPRAACRFFPADSLPSKDRRGVSVRQLLPDPVTGLRLERLLLSPGASMAGVPHLRGSREYLTCERGRIELRVAGQAWTLDPGDVVVFEGDRKHGYRNLGSGQSVGYSVIVVVEGG